VAKKQAKPDHFIASPAVCAWMWGRWQDQEWPEAEALITDPPYSSATHRGARSQGQKKGELRAPLEFDHIEKSDCADLADRFHSRVSQWAVIFCDHISYQWHADAWEGCGWHVFAPVVWVKSNAAPRFQGDGPASAVEYLMIARPKHRPKRPGSRPGYYLAPVPRSPRKAGALTRGAGHKDPLFLRYIVDGYTDPGDTVLDPYGGTATMGAAALGSCRKYMGSEVDPDMHRAGSERLKCVPPLLPGLELLTGTQPDLL